MGPFRRLQLKNGFKQIDDNMDKTTIVNLLGAPTEVSMKNNLSTLKWQYRQRAKYDWDTDYDHIYTVTFDRNNKVLRWDYTKKPFIKEKYRF